MFNPGLSIGQILKKNPFLHSVGKLKANVLYL